MLRSVKTRRGRAPVSPRPLGSELLQHKRTAGLGSKERREKKKKNTHTAGARCGWRKGAGDESAGVRLEDGNAAVCRMQRGERIPSMCVYMCKCMCVCVWKGCPVGSLYFDKAGFSQKQRVQVRM